LDFGCGVKLVQGLIEMDSPQAFYLGMDVFGKMIDWLKDAMAGDAKYQLETVPFQNDMYNKVGEKMTADSVLPGPIKEYDILCMFSVITHMNPADASAIFHIMHKLVKDDGILVFSTFVDPAQEVDFYDEKPKRPLLRARFKKSYIDQLVTEAGWKIKTFSRPIKGVIQSHYICTK
jgi:2-polyprenyl-3-methyl-5-hydroxy-6-metoxy-1,4-benzoquinol methylase